MTDIINEQSRWAREKSKVIFAFEKDRNELLSTVAGRGFQVLPGFLYGLQTDLEINTKFKLSDANFIILTEIVERELKDAKLDYDIAFKNALMIWETEKQGLLNAWDQEYAGIKQGMAWDEEAVMRLAIDVKARELYLVQQKADIELDMEEVRNLIAGLGTEEALLQVDLANKKLLVAQKKLTLIPILQTIIEKETELIAKENERITAEGELVDARRGVADKKLELIPVIAQLVSTIERYKTAITLQAAVLSKISAVKVQIADVAVQKAAEQLAAATTRLEIAGVETQIVTAKAAVDQARTDGEISQLIKELALLTLYVAGQDSTQGTIIALEEDASLTQLNKKDQAIDTDKASRLTQISDSITNHLSRINTASQWTTQETKDTADIRAITSVTSTLVHLLGV